MKNTDPSEAGKEKIRILAELTGYVRSAVIHPGF